MDTYYTKQIQKVVKKLAGDDQDLGLFKKLFLNRVGPSKSIQLESCSDCFQ